MSPGDNPLVHAVGRVPVTVHTKLLVAFVGTAILVVAVGLLGLRVLGQSNHRVEQLGTLQHRATAYGKLQSDAFNVRMLLAENVNPAFYRANPLDGPAPTGKAAAYVDKAVVDALARIGPKTVADGLGFVPSAEDARVLRQIRATSARLSMVMREIIAAEVRDTRVPKPLRSQSEQLAITLNHLAADLADATTAKTDAVITQNANSYVSSRNLFIGVAAGAIVLALLLGFVLSWSLIGPIQRINARLAAIASGDFSGRVEVPNRDELGALGANVNRMNDELRSLYSELEAVSRHKSEFLANTSHELRTPMNAIIGFSELLLQQSFGPLNERQIGYVDDVLDSGRHLLLLINDILDLSKVEAGMMELELADVSLRQALESGLAMHAETATRAGIELGLKLRAGRDHHPRRRAEAAAGRLQPALERGQVHAVGRPGRRLRRALG